MARGTVVPALAVGACESGEHLPAPVPVDYLRYLFPATDRFERFAVRIRGSAETVIGYEVTFRRLQWDGQARALQLQVGDTGFTSISTACGHPVEELFFNPDDFQWLVRPGTP